MEGRRESTGPVPDAHRRATLCPRRRRRVGAEEGWRHGKDAGGGGGHGQKEGREREKEEVRLTNGARGWVVDYIYSMMDS